MDEEDLAENGADAYEELSLAPKRIDTGKTCVQEIFKRRAACGNSA